jgi:hypothetical protein
MVLPCHVVWSFLQWQGNTSILDARLLMIALEVGTSGILHISTFTLLIKELHYHKTHHKNLNEMVEKYYCIRKTSLAVGNLNHKILLNSEKN